MDQGELVRAEEANGNDEGKVIGRTASAFVCCGTEEVEMGDERQIEPRRLPFLRSGRRLTRDLLYCYALADLKKAMPLILVPNFSCDVVENGGRRRLARKEAFFASRGFLVMR